MTGDVLGQVQRQVHEAIGGRYWPCDTICLRLGEEVSEVNKARRKETVERVSEEIGDVLFTLVCLANVYGFDLDQIMAGRIANVPAQLEATGVDPETGRLPEQK